MPNISPVGSEVQKLPFVRSYLWSAIGANQVGDPVSHPDLKNVTVQAGGTFSGQTLTLQGSVDGTTYTTLKDSGGTDITWTSAGMKQLPLGVVPPYIRPSVSNGGSPAIDLTMCMSK